LEEDFGEFAGADGQLDAGDLESIWLKCAARRGGSLTVSERAVIKTCARMYLHSLDLDGSGKVSHTEFVTYMLGGTEDRGALHNIREDVQRSFKADPALLKQVIQTFKELDINGDGFVTRDELAACVDKGRLLPSLGGGIGTSADMLLQLDELDVDGDGKLDIWELIAHTLGRRKTPVELLLYDISGGASKLFSPLLFGRKFEAIYHSGLLAFGKEYWYGGQVFKTEPPATAHFGTPLFRSSATKLAPSRYRPGLRTVHLGYTLATQAEFEGFLRAEMISKYTPDAYDVMSHNCNCFSNEAVRFLTGAGIPEEVMNLPELVMSTPTAKLLRPVLNKWLGGFGSPDRSSDLADDSAIREVDEDTIRASLLGTGDIVVVQSEGRSEEEQLACVDKDLGDGHVQVQCFDPTTSAFVMRSVDKKKTIRMAALSEGGSQSGTAPLPVLLHSTTKTTWSVSKDAAGQALGVRQA
jgi:Ca2+-binding EF-hand superfamily protein